jgi:hypothetical protein
MEIYTPAFNCKYYSSLCFEISNSYIIVAQFLFSFCLFVCFFFFSLKAFFGLAPVAVDSHLALIIRRMRRTALTPIRPLTRCQDDGRTRQSPMVRKRERGEIPQRESVSKHEN